jgi:RNA polymerase subunit RPABC4/transcription elongation factor Spt4
VEVPIHVKVCRDCGEEYRLEATACTDCGGELVVRQLDETGAVLEPEDEISTPPAADPAEVPDHRVIFVTPHADDLVPLAEALREHAIPYRLAEQPASAKGALPRYALLVPDAEAPAALRTLAPLLAPHEAADDVVGIETRFEPERGYVQCPACGADQAQGAVECAVCGLGLGGGDEGGTACAHCGAPLPDGETTCPSCGRAHHG